MSWSNDFRKVALMSIFDTCCDADTRRRLIAVLKEDGEAFEKADQESRGIRKPVAEVGDKIQGAGYCSSAPGGIVYHVDKEGFAHCVTITGKDGGLAQGQYQVFGKVEFVPEMLRAYRNVVIEEIAKAIDAGPHWMGLDCSEHAASVVRGLKSEENICDTTPKTTE